MPFMIRRPAAPESTGENHERTSDPIQTQEIRCPVRSRCRQYRAVHGGPQRQRSALSRLRHPRRRHDLRIRGDRPSARARQAADARRARRLQEQAAVAARHSGGTEGGTRAAAGIDPSDGRHAHRRFGARLPVAGEGRSQPSRCARHRRPPDGLARLGPALLVSLCRQRQAHRRRDRRRFDRRTFPASAARQAPERTVDAGHAHLADPLRRARIQCFDIRRARHRRHRQRHVFEYRRRHRRLARTQARWRQRGRLRDPEALRNARTRPRPTSASG